MSDSSSSSSSLPESQSPSGSASSLSPSSHPDDRYTFPNAPEPGLLALTPREQDLVQELARVRELACQILGISDAENFAIASVPLLRVPTDLLGKPRDSNRAVAEGQSRSFEAFSAHLRGVRYRGFDPDNGPFPPIQQYNRPYGKRCISCEQPIEQAIWYTQSVEGGLVTYLCHDCGVKAVAEYQRQMRQLALAETAQSLDTAERYDPRQDPDAQFLYSAADFAIYRKEGRQLAYRMSDPTHGPIARCDDALFNLVIVEQDGYTRVTQVRKSQEESARL